MKAKTGPLSRIIGERGPVSVKIALVHDIRKKSLRSFSWLFFGFAGFDGAPPQTPQAF